MKLIKLSLVTVLLTAAMASTASATNVEASANVAMTSNYVWRGMSQTANSPATQGGFDVSIGNVYAGVWGSNVNFGNTSSLEADLYAGYASEIFGLAYDLNYNQFIYPNETKSSNFGEASLSLAYDFEVLALSAKYYVGIKTNDFNAPDAWEVGVSVPLVAKISIDATYGDYDGFGTYYLASVSKSYSKFDFSLAYTAMDRDNIGEKDEDNLVFTVATSF